MSEVKEGGKVVVRLVTTYWVSQRGLHTKKDIIFLKRKSEGFNWLEEDSLMSGCDGVIPLIVNLGQCEDGIYEVIHVNESTDWESGHVDSWEYKLIPFIGGGND